MRRYPALFCRTHSAQVDRSIAKQSDNLAYHFCPCMPPISFNLGVSNQTAFGIYHKLVRYIAIDNLADNNRLVRTKRKRC